MDIHNRGPGHDADGRSGDGAGRMPGISAGAKLLRKSKYWVISFIVIGLVVVSVGNAMTQTAPTLGTAESFGVLGGSTVTNTGPTVINGDLGVWPGLAITGFPPGIVLPPGATHAGDAVALQAQSDVTTAYNSLAGQPCYRNLTGLDLGGLTLTPGVYCFDTAAQLTGDLTLDTQGNADAVFIFQIGSTLTTAPGASVIFVNGTASCNVFWQVGSSATLNTTKFAGNIVALTSITLNTGASMTGRVLARNGAVTMDSNTIARCVESAGSGDTPLPATLTVIALTPTPIIPSATQTAIAAEQTALAATQTAVAATEIAIAPTLTAIAMMPTPTLSLPTQTAIAATQTAAAATQIAVAPALTSIAMTPIPQALDESAQPHAPVHFYLPRIGH